MKYKKGTGFIAGIPARDLSENDIDKYVIPLMASQGISGDPHDWLASTGLYEPIKKKSKPKESTKITGKKDGE
jgi:hypothetical protein